MHQQRTLVNRETINLSQWVRLVIFYLKGVRLAYPLRHWLPWLILLATLLSPFRQTAVHNFTQDITTSIHMLSSPLITNGTSIPGHGIVLVTIPVHSVTLWGHFSSGLSLIIGFWRYNPHWAMASSFTKSLDHTQQRTTVGRTLLDE